MGKIETPDSTTRGILNLSRRSLLKGTGGLALGIFFAPLLRGMDALAAGGPLEPNAFVRICSQELAMALCASTSTAR
jgi:isoquinoline 1-oxidoreductase beta subunit